MKITVAQLGARRHYAVPVFLERAGLLHRFITDLCANDWRVRWAQRLLPNRLKRGGMRRILDRRVPEVPDHKIECFPFHALSRSIRSRGRSETPSAVYQGYVTGNRAFGERVVRRGLGDADAVYTFNGAGLEILRHARQRGLRTIVDQTMAAIAVVETLLDEERQRWPGWEDDAASQQRFWQPLAEREEAEWKLADQILCGSPFVAESVGRLGGPADRCTIVPYGFQPLDRQVQREENQNGPLNVLFVGTVGLRKGVPYLMEAARLLADENVRVRAVGPIQIGEAARRQLAQAVELTGPVPRSQVDEHYQWADVLVLPTLAEGSANVCYEAMARGLPVITTPNAGSVLRDGVDGYLVPIRSADTLADRIATLAGDRQKLHNMGESARQRVEQFTWDAYANRLVHALTSQHNQRADRSGGQINHPIHQAAS